MKKISTFFFIFLISLSVCAERIAFKEKKIKNSLSADAASADKSCANDLKKSKPKRVLIDKMVGIVHGPERSEVFCLSDDRRGIDGRMRNLKTCIAEELTYQDLLRLKIPADDSVVKEHLNRTIQMFGLKPGDEEKIFAQEGFSYEEGFNKFRLMYANNVMSDYRIKQGMFISEQEVITYFNEHPVTKEPKYKLKTAFVPIDREKGQKSKGVQMDIEKFIKTGKGVDVTWSDAYWIVEKDLADNLSFVKDMHEGSIEKQKTIDGFQLYKMEAKKPERIVPLKKRYREIVDTLRKPKFEITLQEYHQSLFDAATIIYL